MKVRYSFVVYQSESFLQEHRQDSTGQRHWKPRLVQEAQCIDRLFRVDIDLRDGDRCRKDMKALQIDGSFTAIGPIILGKWVLVDSGKISRSRFSDVS